MKHTTKELERQKQSDKADKEKLNGLIKKYELIKNIKGLNRCKEWLQQIKEREQDGYKKFMCEEFCDSGVYI